MDRIDRISSEMQKVISEIIREDIKDPRVPLMTSVVSANVTRDLKYAKIYISVLGTEAEKKSAMAPALSGIRWPIRWNSDARRS